MPLASQDIYAAKIPTIVEFRQRAIVSPYLYDHEYP
jgi:hypothetical protein